MIHDVTQAAVCAAPIPAAAEPLQMPLRDKLGQIVARTVQDLCRDIEDRKKNWKTDVKKLDAGVWSQNIYYTILKAANQTKRLNWFVEQNRFYHNHPPKDAFELIPDESSASGFMLCKIILKKGVKASDALKAAQTQLCLLDCAQTCQIGQYQALYEILGQDKFDKLFSHDSAPLVLSDYFYKGNPLLVFLKYVQAEPGQQKKLLTGHRVAFDNDDRYNQKHLMGETKAINAIVLEKEGKTLFVGQELAAEGSTKEQVEQFLIDEYNAPPMGLEIISDALANYLFPYGGKQGYRDRCTLIDPRCGGDGERFLVKAGKARAIALKTMKEFGQPLTRETAQGAFGFAVEQVLDFDVELIEELVRRPLNEVSMDLVNKFRDNQIEKERSNYC